MNLWRGERFPWHAGNFYCPIFFYFYFLPDQLHYNVKNMCVLHIPDYIEIVYEIPLLLNKAASEIFLHKSGAMRSPDWSVYVSSLK